MLLSGGEPLLLKGWQEVLGAARKHNLMTTLFSHAGGIGPIEAQVIKQAAVYDVAVSVYSMQPEIHDQVTQRPGSLKKSLAGVEALLNAGVHVTLRGVALAGINGIDGLRSVDDWVRAQNRPAQLRFVPNSLVMPRSDGSWEPCQYNVDPVQATKLLLMQGVKTSESLGDLVVSEDMAQQQKAPLCGAGLTALHVEANGQVRPCMALPEVVGDIRQESLQDVWQRMQKKRQTQGYLSIEDFSECQSCAYKRECRPCQALSVAEHGRLDKPSYLSCAQTFAAALADKNSPKPPVKPEPLRRWEAKNKSPKSYSGDQAT